MEEKRNSEKEDGVITNSCQINYPINPGIDQFDY